MFPGPSTSGSVVVKSPIKWECCVICQARKNEKLVCPAKGKVPTAGSGYHNFAGNVKKFLQISSLPVNIDIDQLNEGEGIEATLRNHSASWHKTCVNKFSALKLERVLKRKRSEIYECDSPAKTRSRLGIATTSMNTCFFCDKSDGNMSTASTIQLDARVREMATRLQDQKLLAKLTLGDMTALDAQYHNQCLTALTNRDRDAIHAKANSTEQQAIEGIALAELVSYVQETKLGTGSQPIFMLSDLKKLYQARLQQLNAPSNTNVNSTRLKERLKQHVPGLTAHTKSNNKVFFVFEENLGEVIDFSTKTDHDSDAAILAKAAQIVRKQMMSISTEFNGSFDGESIQQAVPDTLFALTNMIMNGTNIADQSGLDSPQGLVGQSICQIMLYNMTKNARIENKHIRHSAQRETPIPVYLALMTHAHTRKRELVDTLHRLGLAISYNRLM